MIAIIKYLINIITGILSILIVLDTLLSYLLREGNPVRRVLLTILTPIYAPIRRFVPPLAGIDFTPLVAIIILQILDAVLIGLLSLIG
jgi:YggT family protein